MLNLITFPIHQCELEMTLLGEITSHRRKVLFAVRIHHNRELYSSKSRFSALNQTPIQLVSCKTTKSKVVQMVFSAYNSGSIEQSDPIKKPEVIVHCNKT